MTKFGRIFGGCYPPRPLTSVDNTLLDLLNSSYPTNAEFINGLKPSQPFTLCEPITVDLTIAARINTKNLFLVKFKKIQ